MFVIDVLNFLYKQIFELEKVDRRPGIEPGSLDYMPSVIPLDHRPSCFPKLFSSLVIVYDILIVGHNDGGTNHDIKLCRFLQICKKVNLKVNKDKCHFRCICVLFFGVIISMQGVNLQGASMKRNATAEDKHKTAIISWHNEFHEQILTSHCRIM